MTESDIAPLSPEELAQIDEKYEPFPSFSSWPKTVLGVEAWDRDYELLRGTAGTASDNDLRAAQEVAMRTAAFDSGAIEGLYRTDRGLTFSVATQALAWEQRVEEGSADALALFRGQLEAFELVMDFVAEHYPDITAAWVRRLHEIITAAQKSYVVHTSVGPQRQPLPKGEYKTHANHVRTADGRVHAYAPVETTQSEMQRFVDELRLESFKNAHPALQAAYVHYALVVIHPFADGNGRVARAVASAFTYRAASVPLLVLAHQRDEYFASLAKADEGAAGDFIAFVASSCREAMQLVTETLRTAQAAQPEEMVAEFQRIYVAQGTLTHQQLDELANEFVDGLIELLNVQVAALSLPDGLEIGIVGGTGGRQRPVPSGFRPVVTPGPRSVQIDMSAAPPATASLNDAFQVFVSTESDPAVSLMVRVRETDDRLIFGQGDLTPVMSSAAQVRLDNFVRRALGTQLERLLATSRAELQKRGY